MTNKIAPNTVDTPLKNSETNQPTPVSEISSKLIQGPDRNIAELKITTDGGVFRKFKEGDVAKPNNSSIMITETNGESVPSNPLPSIVEPNDESKPSSSLPVVTNIDDQTEPSNQVAMSNQVTLAIASAQPERQMYVTNFVPPPVLGNRLPTLPDNPYDFEHFKHYIDQKLCYNSAPLTQSAFIKAQERIAYRIDMWTLMEQRSVEWRTKPYTNEETPGKTLGNIFHWEDLPFETPRADLEREVKASCPLKDTQCKIRCTSCNGKGTQPCPSCHGQGHIIPRSGGSTLCPRCRGQGRLNCSTCTGSGLCLKWAVLTVKWNSFNTVSCCQNTFLPEKMIRRRLNKSIFFDGEQEWANNIFLTSYNELYQNIHGRVPADLSDKLGKELQKQYQTHFIQKKQSTLIRRIKCLIRQVDIIEVDYRLEGYVNKGEQHRGECYDLH